MSTDVYAQSNTASAVAYHQLKTLLLMGDVPVGVRLREERIADRLGMSRTPIREAMLRLHVERFLDRHPEGGFRATVPSAQTMQELYEVRSALELCALRRVRHGGGHDRRVLVELRDEWHLIKSDSQTLDAEFVLLDEDFHGRLAESAGNHQLSEELRSISERIRSVRTHDFITPGRIHATVEQHLAILDAILDRRVGRAASLLEEHIGESRSVVEVAVARVLERMLSVEERDDAW
ncbi:MAG TPA: GntR family transcriptional regulator [Acidimicrobiales bacterium]|nr:GntR family transcriptional regulator [Acidimicrobiales bacterium]